MGRNHCVAGKEAAQSQGLNQEGLGKWGQGVGRHGRDSQQTGALELDFSTVALSSGCEGPSVGWASPQAHGYRSEKALGAARRSAWGGTAQAG